MDDRTGEHLAKGLRTDAQRTTANCRGFRTAASMLFESVSGVRVSDGSGGLKNEHKEDMTIYPGSAKDALRPAVDDHYTQEHPKSGVTIKCREIW
jgi:hypothetical protein